MNKKYHNKYKKTISHKRHILKFGFFGLKSITSGRLTELKINTLLRLLNKNLKILSKNSTSVKFWNLIFMNSTLTSLSPESRMGKGKGSIYAKSCYVKPGQILFEFSGISESQMIGLFTFLKGKIPLKTKIISFLK
uniref:Ribosomal protein L16 n=1 Tax=Sirodotia delicatula TaxID=386631 RepID=A0A343UY46_9FLOR|nr:ribosomal protein L16 [Sirodotia delicatula]AVK39603.1 ribosomal protein L16 [Sirodotia delicatula]